MIPETSAGTSSRMRSLPSWVVALGPLLLLAALVLIIVRTTPADRLRSPDAPPIERLAIKQTILQNNGIVLAVLHAHGSKRTVFSRGAMEDRWKFRR